MVEDEPNENTFVLYKTDTDDKRKELLVNMMRIQEAFYVSLSLLKNESIQDKKEAAVLRKIFDDVSNAMVKLSKAKLHVSHIAQFFFAHQVFELFVMKFTFSMF